MQWILPIPRSSGTLLEPFRNSSSNWIDCSCSENNPYSFEGYDVIFWTYNWHKQLFLYLGIPEVTSNFLMDYMATRLGHMDASDSPLSQKQNQTLLLFFMILLVVLATPPHSSIMEMDNILLGLYLCFVALIVVSSSCTDLTLRKLPVQLACLK